MSSPEVERFEITEDDLHNEFNPNRPQFRQTKHKATYGIWADEDSDDERPSFGKKGKSVRDFTAPMAFVSGGVKVGDKVTKEGEEEDDEKDSDSDMEMERTMIANRFGGKRSGGRQPSAYVPKNRQPGQAGLGDWEIHTRGIGAKLLEKYGHVAGKGLGKSLQGISTPVEAFKRKGKAALGFYGTERTERSMQDFPMKQDEDEKEAEEFRQQMQQWKKGEKGERKKKPKYVYKTADEIIASGGSKKRKKEICDLPKVKVIDMTGKEQRVLSGYQALSHKHDRPMDDDLAYSQMTEKKHFDMPELLHNLDLLVEMAEEEIVDNDRKLKYEQDMEVNLRHEQEKNTAICTQEEKQINRIKDILEIIEKCESRLQPGSSSSLTLEECASMLKRIQEEYYEEYRMFELDALALAIVYPLTKSEFEGWSPLTKPRQGMVTARRWKELLGGVTQPYALNASDAVLDPFDRVMWEVWMPHVREAVKAWNVRQPDPMIELVEAWKPVLPDWITQNVLEQLVLPQLQTNVEEWNPLTDTVPIHAWLHPWLPLMGVRLEPLYGPIRHKLANALTNWHPSDASAKLILQPWVNVFSKAHMDAFLIKNILPKLNMCMMEFVINPLQQILDPWHWVMSWQDLLPTPSLVGLLEATFFPQWMRVLCSWLGSNPNYDEVTKWYTGWKSMFPDVLLREPAVSEYFSKALEVMNRAVTGHFQPGARENVAYLTSVERRRQYEPIDTGPRDMESVKTLSASSSVPASFRDMVERRAEENNLEFVPIPNKTQEAKQVYRFGRLQIYLDRSVVFVKEPTGVWIPVSLNGLVDRAR